MEIKQRTRKARTVPFGFAVDENDPTVLVPVEKEQEIIRRARDYYFKNRSSLRGLITWIHAETGRRLSLRGLQSVMERGW